ncbi:MAG: hypothetical protein NC909_01540, partial [Candidatus Omnitrophica bacterium]|nr:hypothetical protein [Candidatus Omnitrophota bacterium]
MLYLILTSLSLNLIFYIIFKRILDQRLTTRELDTYNQKKHNIDFLENNYSIIMRTVEELKEALETHIQLYEVSQQLYNFLDEEKIFLNFKEILCNFVEFKDCLLIKGTLTNIDYDKNDILLQLNINSDFYGFLVIKGLTSEEGKEKLYILTQQFLLALKRAI